MTKREKLYADLIKSNPKGLNYPYDEISEIIGLDAFVQLCIYFNGMILNIPNLRSLMKIDRDNLIKIEHNNGLSCHQLSEKYGLCEGSIRKILKK